MALKLYWRQLTRNGKDDVDFQADETVLNTKFSDFFGKWLQTGENANLQSFDKLVLNFFGTNSEETTNQFSVTTYVVADGGFFDLSKSPGASEWFNPHIRFVTLVTLAGRSPFSPALTEWTLCIVGGGKPKNESGPGAFLQVASWNGSTFRFYERNSPQVIGSQSLPLSWIYLGESYDAFGESQYLGPFNGHVNGACIMKELHQPWLHWLGGAPVDIVSCLSQEEKEEYMSLPYLTNPNTQLFSAVDNNPEDLEQAIRSGVNQWFRTRNMRDFFDSSSKLLESPSNIPRWVAHLFLTTTINIGASSPVTGNGAGDVTAVAKASSVEGSWIIPDNHFYNQETISQPIFGSFMPPNSALKASFSANDYQKAAEALNLCLLQEVYHNEPWDTVLPWRALGGDKREDLHVTGPYPDVHFKTVLSQEGEIPFNILHCSFEDAVGVNKFQTLKVKSPTGGIAAAPAPDQFVGLFSETTIQALMILDFWNPIYSWRRGVLMQYVPQTTTFNGETYDLDARFIANVKESSWVQGGHTDSPEYQLIALLAATLESHQSAIQKYFSAIRSRLKNNPVEALTDYLTLAESRRRIYRPLPLDEFGYTLPYAKSIPPDAPFMEMTSDGTISTMPDRGQRFLMEWTTTLAGVDPILLPQPAATGTQAPISSQALPRPNRLAAVRCQASLKGNSRGSPKPSSGCPHLNMLQATNGDQVSATTGSGRVPNWTDDILPMIKNPVWCHDQASTIGAGWINDMKYWGSWNLDEYEDVKKRAVSIYQHLRSKTMPITRDPQEYWPDDSLETFRIWANAGFPQDASDVPTPKVVIPKSQDIRQSFNVRRDIMSLSQQELSVYQSKLDDVLQIGVLGSKWQELGLLHTEWCLHYQEATFFWHRAYLLHVEKLIGFPIPYWNGFSGSSADPTSADAGIPRVFLEETYIHPRDGSVRPNPLKYALALDGKSKTGKGQWVTRDPTLVTGSSSPDWARKISLFSKYHQQIILALQQTTFTSKDTQEGFGVPWANIPTFSDDQADSLYPYRFDFDGLFEQVHDNYHGWVGPDMADNSYTAFDPIFLSYHANLDRLVGTFLDANPETHLTSSYPLQPFIDNATSIAYEDPRRWIYTTIGDMAKDTRTMGYMYGLPVSPDAYVLKSAMELGRPHMSASGGRALSVPAGINPVNGNNKQLSSSAFKRSKKPFIVFQGIGCTTKSYRIDVFTSGAKSTEPCSMTNPDFIGQVTRLGMGLGRKGRSLRTSRRCREPVATRVLQAESFSDQLSIDKSVKLVVTCLDDSHTVDQKTYDALGGFSPVILWLPDQVQSN